MSSETLKKLVENAYPRWSPTMYRATLVAMIAAAFVIPLTLVALPFIQFFNGMAAQPKGKTQMTYGRLFDEARLVDRQPVPGTIHRDYQPYAFADLGNKIEDARKVGEALQNPVPATMENMLAGQKLYNVYCIVCHGQQGGGDGPVVGPERYPAPPSLHTDQARGYADGTILHIITKGLGQMPSYADKLTHEQRWQVIHYLRALQRAAQPLPEDLERE